MSTLFGVNAAETPAKGRIPTSAWSQRNFVMFAGHESIGAFVFFGGQSDNLNCAKLMNQIVPFTRTPEKKRRDGLPTESLARLIRLVVSHFVFPSKVRHQTNIPIV